MEFIIVRADKPRGIEFNPREAGGGVKDLDVPLDDPRMQFGPNGEKPIATKFYDYVLLLMPINLSSPIESMVAMSLKSTGLKVAKQMNSLIKMRSTPLFSMRYTLTAHQEKNSQGQFGVFRVAQAGYIQDKALYHCCEKVFNAMREVPVAFTREPGDDTEAAPVNTEY